MRKQCFLLLLALSLTPSVESAEAILSLHIDAPGPEVKIGSPVNLHLVLTNTSKSDINFDDTSDFCDYSINVLTRSGEKAPQTALRKDIQCVEDDSQPRVTGRRILRTLKPGESLEETLNVAEFNEMISADVYSVEVTRILRIPGRFKVIGKFTSNVAFVNITDD